MAIGGNIQRIRKLKRLSVSDLAEKTGIKSESIYAWERGEYNPNEENLQKIGRALGVPVKEFYDENNGGEEKLLSESEQIKLLIKLVEAKDELIAQLKINIQKLQDEMEKSKSTIK